MNIVQLFYNYNKTLYKDIRILLGKLSSKWNYSCCSAFLTDDWHDGIHLRLQSSIWLQLFPSQIQFVQLHLQSFSNQNLGFLQLQIDTMDSIEHRPIHIDNCDQCDEY